MKTFFNRAKSVAYEWDFVDEEGRDEIQQWSKNRQQHFRGINKTYHGFLVYTFTLNTIKNFFQNFNFMVIIQMILAGLSIYIFQRFNVYFDMNVGLYLSPIVFPLSFSINADFQRREKVLEDLATFKSDCMFWFFSVKEWKEIAGLDEKWMTESYLKLKTIIFYLREYLLTERIDRREVILKAMYEDVSDCSQLIAKVRASRLPKSGSIVFNLVTYLNGMMVSFERLRVAREYRSPRSIRAFNKVLILLLPILITPYYVHLSRDSTGKIVRAWTPYYISIGVSFVFSALQGVQDKLDDPFDGMSEDDINLEQIDEWTFSSLQATVNRSFKVGRFHVNNIDCHISIPNLRKLSMFPSQCVERRISSDALRKFSSVKIADFLRQNTMLGSIDLLGLHPHASVLEKISGETTIRKDEYICTDVSKLSSLEVETSFNSQNNKPDENTPHLKHTIGKNEMPATILHNGNKKALRLGRSSRGSSEIDAASKEPTEKINFCNKHLPLPSPLPSEQCSYSDRISLLPKKSDSLESCFKLTQIPQIPSFSSSRSSSEIKSLADLNVSFETESPNARETVVVMTENSGDDADINKTEKDSLLPTGR